ncbi:MAG: DUF2190 family protein [Schlesneria sp.]
MAQMAQFLKGSYPNMGDYTPAADMAAGDVAVVGDTLVICVGGAKTNGGGTGISANVLGAVVIRGGIFVVQADAAIAVGKRVYWDATNKKVTLTRGTNLQFGFVLSASSGANAYCNVEFAPGRGDEATSLVTPTGSTIADAAALNDGFNLVTGADGTKGVLLPTASPGRVVKVKNATAAVLKVWPNAAGQAINALSAGAALSMASLASADFQCVDGVTWYTNPTVPS